MSTSAEQLFLYGEVLEPEFHSVVDLLGHLDLTAGAAGVFAAMILLTFLGVLWQEVIFCISTGVKHLVSLVRAVVSGARWFVQSVTAARSPGKMYAMYRDGAKFPFCDWPLCRLVYAVVCWCFPSDRPMMSACRLWGTFLCVTGVYFALLLPGLHQVSGIAGGLGPEGWDMLEYCVHAHGGGVAPGRWVWRQWLEIVRCNGVETGLVLRDLIDEGYRLLRDDREIDHLPILALAAVCVSLILVAAWSFAALAEVVSRRKRVVDPLPRADSKAALTPVDETPLRGTPPQQSTAIPSALGRLLFAKTEELRAAKQQIEEIKGQMEEACAQVKSLTACRVEAKVMRPQDVVVINNLQRDLAEAEGRLSVARGRLRVVEENAVSKESALEERVAQLEDQLEDQVEHKRHQAHSLSEVSSLRAELQARNDQLVALEGRLAAAEASPTVNTKAGKADNEAILAENQRLAAENQKLAAKCQALVMEFLDLQTAKDELSQRVESSLAAAHQERDAALGQVLSLQSELGSTQKVMESMAKDAEESQVRAKETETALRSSNAELKRACELASEQGGMPAGEAPGRILALEKEIEELQKKVGIAMRDAQRKHSQAVDSQRVNEVLEHRLAKWEHSRDGQEIPKRRTGDVGSITTALEQSRVKVSEQQTEIEELRKQLSKLKETTPSPDEQVQAYRKHIEKLRETHDETKREHMKEHIRWARRTAELDEEVRRLRIELSEAGFTSRHRGGNH
ncbi:integral membrane protein [Aspergillus heteromorphus CBS 117.55]|uniref:Integral membrane protein n=1 Tax=Aspergillus heteromorphus CBS 117.55 TaxID=1448321 RepID=A0A317VZA4_9EURO|nr:uncharacterized protein BO70DRAFT_294091 [Aspergillus heteromorphus CBS 117.55]PWY78352.1 integral membrane protein [Aspergillus heteromorphus CBS 117.55]